MSLFKTLIIPCGKVTSIWFGISVWIGDFAGRTGDLKMAAFMAHG